MTKTKKIIIVAGEESGDMYAANIIKNFSKIHESNKKGGGAPKSVKPEMNI